MRNTFFKLWVHSILMTEPECVPIYPELAPLLYLEIEKRLIEQGCECVTIGGCADHIHFLFAQNPLLSLHETIRFVQGISERWYQLHDFKSGYAKFKWANGYCAYSVSESVAPKVAEFIDNQLQIHQRMYLKDEIHYLNQLHNVDLRDEELEVEIQNWGSKYSFKHIGKEWL
ncbi:MAG: transposase [Saprospiraceae bacterium]|nr:transposase [Saprospiraceae bacterium]